MLFFGKKYKVVFFDLDHTLWDFDSNAFIAIKELFTEYKLNEQLSDFQPFYDAYVKHNRRLWAEYEAGNLKKELLRFLRFHLALRDFGINDQDLAKDIGEAYITRCPLKTILFPYAREVLDYLYPKYEMAIISNGFAEVQRIKLQTCGLDKYFKRVFTSEQTGFQKPRPEIFHAAVTAFNAKKKDCIMIGDSWDHDMAGAKNYGIDHIYFNPDKKEQKSPEATFEINSLSQIINIL
jgi:putative hydrolase of the HAD superfamily